MRLTYDFPMPAAEFDQTFARLRALLKPYEPKTVLATDTPQNYLLITNTPGPNKQPIYFANVRLGKAYVSYHLIPVYMFPDLLDGLAPELKKRMQGKSCFNFKTVDDGQLAALGELTQRCFERYQREKIV
jgi:hypothetical protein